MRTGDDAAPPTGDAAVSGGIRLAFGSPARFPTSQEPGHAPAVADRIVVGEDGAARFNGSALTIA
jgi:hypothetical protein